MQVAAFLRAGITLSPVVLGLSPACGDSEYLKEARASDSRGDYEISFRHASSEHAEKGEVAAQLESGKRYDVGMAMHQDMEFDIDLSRLWLKRAADQGSPEAQYLLGRSYVATWTHQIKTRTRQNDGSCWRRSRASRKPKMSSRSTMRIEREICR